MRALLAALLSVLVLAMASAPHAHAGPHGDHDCAACLARTVDQARSETPDVTPHRVALPGEVPAPAVLLADGAPLGAVPGQSPPHRA